jgi:hypothetical protein
LIHAAISTQLTGTPVALITSGIGFKDRNHDDSTATGPGDN